MNFIRRKGYPLVVAESYATMEAGVDSYATAGHEDISAELYARGKVGPGGQIAKYYLKDGILRPSDTIKCSLVSPSQFGQLEAAPNSGSTRELKVGHNLSLSGLATAWDLSASADIAKSAAWTRAGTTITFTAGDPGLTAEDDLIITEGVCEFGELRTKADGGLWSPRPNSGMLAVWVQDKGLRCVPALTLGDETTGVVISFAGKPNPIGLPDVMVVSGLFDFLNNAAARDSLWGIGLSSANDFKTGLAGWVRRVDPHWQKGAFTDFLTNLQVASTGNMGLPVAVADVRATFTATSLGDAVNVAYQTQSSPATPGVFLSPQNQGVAANGVGAGTTFGPCDGVLIGLRLKDLGEFEVTMKELTTRWI